MPEVDRSDLISYEDAAEQFGVSVRWLQAQENLTVAKLPGDRKHYILKSEVQALMQPRFIRGPKADEEGGTKAG